jgi:glycosyltransferase involved in cell wall biosynthesis
MSAPGTTGPTSADAAPPRPLRLLTSCPFVPHPHMLHAGGQYLYDHLTALRQRYSCVLVAPATDENREVAARGQQVVETVLAEPAPRARARRWQLLHRRAWDLLHPLRPGAEFEPALRSRLIERLGDCDVVELQWPEYVGLLPAIKKHAPEVPVVVVEHDVLSQRLSRAARQGVSWKSRLRSRLSTRHVARLERKLLNQASRVVVFSDKDAALLRRNGVQATIEVVLPPLEDERMWGSAPAPQGPDNRILFVAAFDRTENVAGVRWMVDEVFPLVRAAVPDATLVLAGAGAGPEVRALAAADGVLLTGMVEDLADVYQSAEVAVVPLLTGAGLKFKVATAMMWGLPVVSTSVGAEGYPADQGLFRGLEDDPRRFAAAVVSALTERHETRAIAGRGQEWALQSFSQAHFRDRLSEIYDSVLPAVSVPDQASLSPGLPQTGRER